MHNRKKRVNIWRMFKWVSKNITDPISHYYPCTRVILFLYIHPPSKFKTYNKEYIWIPKNMFWIYWVGVYTKIYDMTTSCHFCIYTHPVNSKFTIWQLKVWFEFTRLVKIQNLQYDKSNEENNWTQIMFKPRIKIGNLCFILLKQI